MYVTGCLVSVVDMHVRDWLSGECCGRACT